MKANN